jgi:hypothetical protein
MFTSVIKQVQSNSMLQVLLVVVGIYLVFKYTQEGLENVVGADQVPMYSEDVVKAAQVPEMPQAPEVPQAPQVPQVPEEKSQLNAEDLLPKYDDANDFAKQNPVSKLLKEQNFLVSGYHVGINTVMQSNKIPYHDLRSAPPIPKEAVSPFLNSSFEQPAGANRRALEVGFV